MDKWLKDYGFSLEVISEACSRTMAAIHQPSFPYTDKILASWKKQGVKSLSDIQNTDQNRSTRKAKGRGCACGSQTACRAQPFPQFSGTRL